MVSLLLICRTIIRELVEQIWHEIKSVVQHFDRSFALQVGLRELVLIRGDEAQQGLQIDRPVIWVGFQHVADPPIKHSNVTVVFEVMGLVGRYSMPNSQHSLSHL